MIARRGRLILIAAMAGGPAGAASPPSSPAPRVYAVTRVGSAIDDDAIVGAKRAGIACLPNGSVRWSEIAAGTVMDRRETVQDALEDAGVPVTPLGTDGAAGRPVANLRATIRSAAVSLCARGWGLGSRRALSGHVQFAIEWRIEARDGTVASHVTELDETLDPHHAVPLGAIYRLMLTHAAKDAARWLLARP